MENLKLGNELFPFKFERPRRCSNGMHEAKLNAFHPTTPRYKTEALSDVLNLENQSSRMRGSFRNAIGNSSNDATKANVERNKWYHPKLADIRFES